MALEVVSELNDEQNETFSRMLQTIRNKRRRNKLRTGYRESTEKLEKLGFSIPPNMRDFQTAIGWADKAVKVPARRIRPDGYILSRTSRLLADVEEITMDPLYQKIEKMAIDASLEHSVAFHFVSPGDPDLFEPEVVNVARTAMEATCEIDPRTRNTTAALEIVDKDKYLLYLPGETFRIEMQGNRYVITKRYAGTPGRVLCTPMVWDESLKRTFGRSRITRPLMGYIDTAVRSMLREEVQAEFFSGPQRALMGADEAHFKDSNGNPIDPLSAWIGSIWALPDVRDDETGDLVRAKLETLSAASFQPHEDMLKGIASRVSGETSIPVTYLGIIHDNPSSADAIRASEADLVSVVTDQLDSIGAARADIARNIATVLEGEWTPAMEKELRGLRSNFKDPGTPTKSEQADAGLKYTQAFPMSDPRVAMEIYGLSRDQIERNMRYAQQQQSRELMAGLLAQRQGQQPGQQVQSGQQPQQGAIEQ